MAEATPTTATAKGVRHVAHGTPSGMITVSQTMANISPRRASSRPGIMARSTRARGGCPPLSGASPSGFLFRKAHGADVLPPSPRSAPPVAMKKASMTRPTAGKNQMSGEVCAVRAM